MMSKEKTREVRVWTWSCAAVGAACVASAMSPSIETFFNRVIGIPVLALTGLFLLTAFGREAWDRLMEWWESRRG